MVKSEIVALLLTCALVTGVCSAKGNIGSKYRSVSIDAIVLHAIAGPYCGGGIVKYSSAKSDLSFWGGFFERHKIVGIHYIIDRDGVLLKGIDENRVANHAIGWNDRSIGIELINKGDGKEVYPHLQMLALEVLVRQLRAKYPLITVENIVRHSDIDNRKFKCGLNWIKQKQDPGPKFDYKKFLEVLTKAS